MKTSILSKIHHKPHRFPYIQYFYIKAVLYLNWIIIFSPKAINLAYAQLYTGGPGTVPVQ